MPEPCPGPHTHGHDLPLAKRRNRGMVAACTYCRRLFVCVRKPGYEASYWAWEPVIPDA